MTAHKPVWAQLAPTRGENLAVQVNDLESAGIEGVWAPQFFAAPFGILSATAMASKRLKLGTGIALAFVRSPLETACNAMDLDSLSDGRAILGLGSSAQSLTEGAFGMRYGKPLAHMRELVRQIRVIIARAHTGELGFLDGEYHRLDLRNFRTLAPPRRTQIPIYLPAVFEKACELAGEIADGLLGHPLWNEQWIRNTALSALRGGLEKSGRARQDVTVNIEMFVAVNESKREAIEDARPTIAFYSQSPQYLRYFDAIGLGAPARALQAKFAAGDFEGMIAACSDEMVESIALAGTKDEVLRRARERLAEADACTPVVPHYALSPEKSAFYFKGIANLFYG